MGLTVALSVSALSGMVLLVMAAALLVSFPRFPAVLNWSWSWALAGLGCLFTAVWPFTEVYFAGTWELTLRTFFVNTSVLALALGFLNWFRVAPDGFKGLGARSLLWTGNFFSLVLVGTGLTQANPWVWGLAAAWTLVPVLFSFFLLTIFGLSRSRPGAVRGQTYGLLFSTSLGVAPFIVTWMVLPQFTGAGWWFGFPPFLVLGACLTFRSLVHHDTRLHQGEAAPFLVRKIQDTVLFLRSDGQIQAVNPAIRILLDKEELEIVGKSLVSLGDGPEAVSVLASLEGLRFTDWEGTLNLVHRTGDPVPVHVVFHRIHNPAREPVGAVLLLYDMRLPRQLDLSIREDLLTSLANRRWIFELLEAEFLRVKRYGGALSVFWVELEHLDLVEDREGREGADEVVRRCASVLRSCLRKTDLCGRVGPKDFLAVLPETPRDKAGIVVFRFERMFALASEGVSSGVGLKVGLADLDVDDGSTDDFVARARASVPVSGSPG